MYISVNYLPLINAAQQHEHSGAISEIKLCSVAITASEWTDLGSRFL